MNPLVNNNTRTSYESRRLVATLTFGGSAQDKEVSADVRKQLYEQVTKDGLYKPKLVDGRWETAIFLFEL